MTLFDVSEGDKAIITKVLGRGAFRKRILEMGFIPGKEVRVVKKAPFKDPIEYNILGYNVSLRNSEARLIEVLTESEARDYLRTDQEPEVIIDGPLLRQSAQEKEKTIHIALVGNPNSGKTTLFNVASGSRERVGNYSGVTVSAKKARIKFDGYTLYLIDLPGTYSLSAYSPEELFVRNYILSQNPDLVINVIDGSNLERNLYLTSQLIDMDVKVVIALNMFDELQQSGAVLDHESLGKLLGIPVVPTISTKSKGIDQLLHKVIEVYEDKEPTVRHIHIHYGHALENAVETIQQKIKIPDNYFLTDLVSSRFLALKLVEKDPDASARIQPCSNHLQIIATALDQIHLIEEDYQQDTESLITDAKYGFIGGALKETLKPAQEVKVKKSEIIDGFFTHKFWGIPVFIFFMWLTFYITFKLGDYPKQWIETGVGLLSNVISNHMGPGPFKDLILQGILGGVGGVIVFLPNILLLFLFISLMEDTGYLARGVFIMDKVMHKIGLHGKSFIPLIMGFGCNVPAIMSTRIIESKRDRLLTMLINPFMSCSARLPVYILFISAFFTAWQGTILFLIYLSGILFAVVSALLFKKTLFKKSEVPFVMELPPYRVPTIRSLLRHAWTHGQQYLKKIGGVILIASIIIWALGYFPRNHELEYRYKKQVETLTAESARLSHQVTGHAATIPDSLKNDLDLRIAEVSQQFQQQSQANSFIGKIGKIIEPVMKPLGFDWKMSVAILTGIAGKEIVVGTLGVLHQAEPGSQDTHHSLAGKLKTYRYSQGPLTGQKVYTPLVALSFMFFILVYFPCIAVIATIRRESGKWKYALFTIVYTTLLAWLVSFSIYQIGQLILH